VDDLSRAGSGVAKDDSGRIIFIPFTAPDDLVKIRIVSQKSKYAQAELLEVLQPSVQRQEPLCPVFGRCGGCEWQHIAYPLQWQTKCQGVKEALKRAQAPLPEAWQEYPATHIWFYRNRIQLHGNKESLGFYAKSSHKIVPIERCVIAREELNAHIEAIRAQGKSLRAPYKVELEVSTNGAVHSTWNSATAAGGFEQVNSEQNHNLQQWVSNNISLHRPVMDLYGGSANLSAQLAAVSPHIHCVDLTIPENDEAQWPKNISFHRRDVFSWVMEQARQRPKNAPLAEPCSAIIDPPRGGMPEQLSEFIDALQRLNVTELIAVGCKADTWARDVAGFVQRGWRMEKVAVFDFFPQTAHVESAALLTYKS
jgi:tRNA/tmRNA/rRNA uracil-C5-methylase (TrmA/RlmC/RlmD family)